MLSFVCMAAPSTWFLQARAKAAGQFGDAVATAVGVVFPGGGGQLVVGRAAAASGGGGRRVGGGSRQQRSLLQKIHRTENMV